MPDLIHVRTGRLGRELVRPSLALCTLLLLTACASRPIVTGGEGANWTLVGKVGVIAETRRGSFGINWQQRGENFDISLFGPLGITAARVYGDRQVVTLEVPGEVPVSAASPDELLYQSTGLALPVTPLRHWVRGKPAPGRFSKTTTGFRQAGWAIEYLRLEQGLPTRMRIERPGVRVTLAVRGWEA